MALVAHASPTGLLADANATQEEAFYNLARTTTTSVSTLFEALDKILQPVDPEENTEAIKTIVAELRRRAIISVGAMAPPNLCYNEIAAVLTKAGRGFWLGALEEYLGYRYERPGLTRPAASGPPPSAALANLSSSRSNAEEKGRGGPRADPYKSGRLGLQLAKDNKLRSFVDQFPIRLLMAYLTAAAHYAEGKKYYCDRARDVGLRELYVHRRVCLNWQRQLLQADLRGHREHSRQAPRPRQGHVAQETPDRVAPAP